MKSNPVTAARIKASELREKEWYVKKMEEVLGPRSTDVDVGSGVVLEVDVREGGIPPVVGRTPVQEGGSSSSGGTGPPPAVPMQLDRYTKRPGIADHF